MPILALYLLTSCDNRRQSSNDPLNSIAATDMVAEVAVIKVRSEAYPQVGSAFVSTCNGNTSLYLQFFDFEIWSVQVWFQAILIKKNLLELTPDLTLLLSFSSRPRQTVLVNLGFYCHRSLRDIFPLKFNSYVRRRIDVSSRYPSILPPHRVGLILGVVRINARQRWQDERGGSLCDADGLAWLILSARWLRCTRDYYRARGKFIDGKVKVF